MQQATSEHVYQYLIGTAILLLCVACVYPLTYVAALSLTSEQEWGGERAVFCCGQAVLRFAPTST